MKPIIEVKNIGKKYTINHQRGNYVALRDILAGAFRNPFSFLKRNIKGVFETKEPFWALKDVSFTVNKGEVIGIIGRNGAGKSTLLKILSRITPPTTGEINIHGTVGSLLEVGTGFHPELTGRENIFLNGAILGMKKAEIVQKFDEIVAFAGIEKFLDTPVKYYSSGMYVRLAFSVAAHLDPDILIVDEVLAVGDAEFQKKCLGKMEEITQKEGRTILFVSHNMSAIRKLCKKTIWLQNGSIVEHGDTENILKKYNNENVHGISRAWINDGTQYTKLELTPNIFEIKNKEDGLYVSLEFQLNKDTEDITIGYALYNEQNDLLYWSYQTDSNDDFELIKGINKIESKIPTELLNNGSYTVELIGGIHGKKWFFEPGKGNPTLTTYIDRNFSDHKYWNDKRPGILAPRLLWKK